MEPAIEIEGLVKRYKGGILALDDISLDIGRGEIFGLLGPNGAGKSTLIHILTGIALKTSGKVRVMGRDLDKDPVGVKRCLGMVPQEVAFDPFFSPREILRITAGYYGMRVTKERIEELLDLLALTEKGDVKARRLSGGMRRRLLVAQAMIHDPPILILDEPTAGVDVEMRRSLWNHVRRLAGGGTTILLTTHYLDEAEELCGRIGIIDRGRLLALDETESLVEMMGRERRIELRLGGEARVIPGPLARFGASIDGGKVELSFKRGEAGEVIDALAGAKLDIEDIRIEKDGLEDAFLRIMGDEQ